ncbi:MAG: GNAT family N-acetyltransferase [Nanoarchaeota archaeon]|nr:GNAT family N-acetyltransferase [Nanoarchaeota archaeon]
MHTINKHIKWRTDNGCILICDCKRLIDLKIDLKFQKILEKFEKGVEKNDLKNEEKLLFLDFERLKLLSVLEIRSIKESEFPRAMKLLDNELKKRVRDNKFLFENFRKFPEFFIGIFLDNELIGIICGFPREDYLLISEIAVDSRFQKRGFGAMLVREFEKNSKGKYNKINVGAQDEVIGFYKLLDYKPFLLIQYKKGDYSPDNLNEFKILNVKENGENVMVEVEIRKPDLNLLRELRKRYLKAYLQYIFSKKI